MNDLRQAVEAVRLAPSSPLFWIQVSLRVPGKTAKECERAAGVYHIELKSERDGIQSRVEKPEKKAAEKKKPSIGRADGRGEAEKLSRKGTLKRKQQLREILTTIEEKDAKEQKPVAFEGRRLNSDWTAAFNLKTPSISRRKEGELNTSVLVLAVEEAEE